MMFLILDYSYKISSQKMGIQRTIELANLNHNEKLLNVYKFDYWFFKRWCIPTEIQKSSVINFLWSILSKNDLNIIIK